MQSKNSSRKISYKNNWNIWRPWPAFYWLISQNRGISFYFINSLRKMSPYSKKGEPGLEGAVNKRPRSHRAKSVCYWSGIWCFSITLTFVKVIGIVHIRCHCMYSNPFSLWVGFQRWSMKLSVVFCPGTAIIVAITLVVYNHNGY